MLSGLGCLVEWHSLNFVLSFLGVGGLFSDVFGPSWVGVFPFLCVLSVLASSSLLGGHRFGDFLLNVRLPEVGLADLDVAIAVCCNRSSRK